VSLTGIRRFLPPPHLSSTCLVLELCLTGYKGLRGDRPWLGARRAAALTREAVLSGWALDTWGM
jgi:hypothetical protein